MAATDPRRDENFRWHNIGLTNTPQIRTNIRWSSCIARCCRKTSCWWRCRSSSSACPSGKPRTTSRRPGRDNLPPLSPKPSGAAGGRGHHGPLRRGGGHRQKYLADHSAGSGSSLCRNRGAATDQGRQRFGPDEADSSHRCHESGRAVSGGDDQRRSGETEAGQRKERWWPAAGEGLRARHDCPIRATYDISDEEALYIKQVTEEKIADPAIRSTVQAHREDLVYLEGPYRGQVNGDIQTTYDAWTLRRTCRPEIHGRRRHLRHHGRDRHPNAPLRSGLNP